jgi:pilus assembly protein CpaE
VTGFLNVEPTYSILDLAKSLRREDARSIEEALVRHVSGVRVLAPPRDGAAAARIKPADIDEIFDRLLQRFDFLIVDTPKEFDDMQLLVLDRAEIILFVTEMDAPSLRSARRTFDFFHRMAVDIGKMRVLLNRYIAIESMSLETIEKILGMSVFWTLPNDYRAVVSAVNQGLPIVVSGYDTDIARSYAALPDALIQSISLGV